MNGESFNYANRNNRTHELLDSSPPGDLIINYENSQKGWLSPRIQEYDYRRERQIKCDDSSKQANVSHETLACSLRERRFSLPPIEHFGPWLETFTT